MEQICKLCGGAMRVVRILWCGEMDSRYKCVECGFLV